MPVPAGAPVRSGTFGETKNDVQDANGTFSSSASYTETLSGGGTPCGVVFTAPDSGKVLISNSAFLDNGTTGRTYCSWIIREGSTLGSGDTFLDGGDTKAITNLGAEDSSYGRLTLVTGLTPGDIYNILQQFKVSAGTTGSAQWKELIVIPVN